jgi:hypothetical protein
MRVTYGDGRNRAKSDGDQAQRAEIIGAMSMVRTGVGPAAAGPVRAAAPIRWSANYPIC